MYLANTIHHVIVCEELYQEILRVLIPGGKKISWDPIAYNPAINVYRRMANKARTEDESPLRVGDLEIIRTYFTNVGSRTFWIFALVLFVKFFLFNRIHPNQKRYRKLIYKPQPLGWWKPIAVHDEIICRLPLLRYLTWNIVIWGEKPIL